MKIQKATMCNRWYYNQDGAQYGPIDESEVVRLIQDGELSSSAPVCPQGGGEWQPARNYACFRVEIYPKMKRPPVEAPASTASTTATGGTSQAPRQAPASVRQLSAPTPPVLRSPVKPAPALATTPAGSSFAWIWIVAGMAVLIGTVVIIFAPGLMEQKREPAGKPSQVVTVTLPPDPFPANSPPASIPPTVPLAEANLQSALSYIQRGNNYFLGEGGESKDYPEALKMFRMAAGMGHAEGQFCLGLMYGHGYGVLRSKAEASMWYQRAAQQGHAVAMLNLGVQLSTGEGIAENDVEAVDWFRKAALQGNINAQFNLGLMHHSGEGVPKNLINAFAWYNIAAANGHDKAAANKVTISALMSSIEISQAQDISRYISTRIQNP